uniref:Uncharacterized protein n=1 Tax=Avena sativa TaxID=4498 RepID=A0ACD5T822_AVESA
MLALTGPYRALVTLGYMYFEFDLKTKGKAHDEVQFSKGVISYYCIPDHKRIILQLPSFQSTVKLVLQHVALPVAASLQVSVVKTGPKDPPVHFDGKITAGTTRNYRQHMVLYDSSVHSGDLVRENGSLVLNRNLVSVYGYTKRPAFAKEEKLALYVCFLDASREIEDIDKKGPEYEDVNDKDNDEDNDNNKDKEEEEEDLKNVVALKCPQSEIVWEHGCLKLKVKVDWTAVLDRPQGTDFFQRSSCLPHGCSIDYRWGIRYE